MQLTLVFDRPCACGCGHPTNLAKKTDTRTGAVKGHPYAALRGHRGPRPCHPNRYLTTFRPGHARANNLGYVKTHLLVAEHALGHALPLRAEVHHIDENKQNNTPRNLVICQDAAYHRMLHARMRVVARRRDLKS